MGNNIEVKTSLGKVTVKNIKKPNNYKLMTEKEFRNKYGDYYGFMDHKNNSYKRRG